MITLEFPEKYQFRTLQYNPSLSPICWYVSLQLGDKVQGAYGETPEEARDLCIRRLDGENVGYPFGKKLPSNIPFRNKRGVSLAGTHELNLKDLGL